jgi:hypothetical protein
MNSTRLIFTHIVRNVRLTFVYYYLISYAKFGLLTYEAIVHIENLRLIKRRPYNTYKVRKLLNKVIFYLFGVVEKEIVHMEAQKENKPGYTVRLRTVRYLRNINFIFTRF